MKKKVISILITLLSLTVLFSACSGNKSGTSAQFKDGEYKAEFKDYDARGWKDYVTVTVSGGKITVVDYDMLNKDDGRKKSEDQNYAKAYPENGEFVKPSEYTKQLEDALIEKQDVEKVDIIATATTSSESFKKLVSALKTNMLRGKTDTVIVG